MSARRFRNLPTEIRLGKFVYVAQPRWIRLLGLAALRRTQFSMIHGLLLPKTRSIHTFGMLFSIDLIWLDEKQRCLRVDRGVKPMRIRSCWQADSVIELPDEL